MKAGLLKALLTFVRRPQSRWSKFSELRDDDLAGLFVKENDHGAFEEIFNRFADIGSRLRNRSGLIRKRFLITSELAPGEG